MGVTCPACGTENRSVAKFCIECIESLPTIFAATELLPNLPQLSQAPHRTALFGEPDVRDDAALPRPSGFIAAPSAASAAPAASATAISLETLPISSGPRRTVEGRKGLWVSVAAFAIALVIGAAGWLVAGAGGLYIYAFGHSSAGAEPEVAMVTSPLAPPAPLASAPVAPVVPVVPLSPLSPLSPSYPLAQQEPSSASPLPQLSPPASAVVTASVNRAAPKSTVTSTPSATVAAPAAVRTAKPSVSSPTLVSREAATTTVADPNAQCIGLGFFAVSRCMAVQCAKAEYSAHASCAGVRQQQRLMEEKRNPTMAN